MKKNYLTRVGSKKKNPRPVDKGLLTPDQNLTKEETSILLEEARSKIKPTPCHARKTLNGLLCEKAELRKKLADRITIDNLKKKFEKRTVEPKGKIKPTPFPHGRQTLKELLGASASCREGSETSRWLLREEDFSPLDPKVFFNLHEEANSIKKEMDPESVLGVNMDLLSKTAYLIYALLLVPKSEVDGIEDVISKAVLK